MKKFVCSVCGYVYEGENPPEFCPNVKLLLPSLWNRRKLN